MCEIKKAKVLGLPITISYDDITDGTLGGCIYRLSHIEIESSLDDHVRAKTLIHELCHMYWSAMGLEDKTEADVCLFETTFWTMMMENPKLLEALYMLKGRGK